MDRIEFSQNVVDKFYQIYDNNYENLKKIPAELRKMGLGNIEMLILTRQELNLGLGESIMLLEMPDVVI